MRPPPPIVARGAPRQSSSTVTATTRCSPDVEPQRTTAGAASIGVDTGGTFTDVTLLDPATGRLWTAKTSSTPDDPSRGFGTGIAEVLKASGLAGADIAPRPARHDGCDQPDPRGQGGARPRCITTHRLQVRARDRPPGCAAPRQPVRLGETEASRTAPAHLRGRRPHRARRSRARAPRRGRRALRRAADRSAGIAADRRGAAAQLRQPEPRAPRRRDPRARNFPARSCRCRATCCPSSANMSAA